MSKEFTKSYAINRIAELNEQIVEMTAEQSETMRYLNKLRDNNKQLKQQLAEKDKEIAHLKEKDNYHLRYELAGADETITNLKQQLAEKDKEIEKLKQELEETNAGYDFTYEQSTEAIKELKQNQTQLAIQELEKVKNLAVVLLDGFCHSIHYSQKEFRGHRYIEFYDLIRGIDNQINELKGEKDVKD